MAVQLEKTYVFAPEHCDPAGMVMGHAPAGMVMGHAPCSVTWVMRPGTLSSCKAQFIKSSFTIQIAFFPVPLGDEKKD